MSFCGTVNANCPDPEGLLYSCFDEYCEPNDTVFLNVIKISKTRQKGPDKLSYSR